MFRMHATKKTQNGVTVVIGKQFTCTWVWALRHILIFNKTISICQIYTAFNESVEKK